MKKLILTFIFLSLTLISYAQEITTYYFIRHAEKLRIDKTDKNPNLNFNGYKRAEAWKDVFSDVPFDAIYSTDYNRTKLTAKPTATSKNLPILLYNPNMMYSEAFQNNTKGKTVLVVGHSNTTNVFVNKILGIEKYNEINDNNNSNLYIVTISNGKISSILLKIN
ncbi:MAG: phosphoglycerate mutase family protein [Flavobacteriaceae bacterium]|jgi:2,3-bisphosphoglycerate-dependent phosphoglycerate mutase|nr:phosphoglycerate mutase family protein [Flavobacteriaceae bacterium]MDG1980698.1 phosphoglycerate mutase family protein [Flavobacteriaceae bacterium]|tara:strand:- start:2474 stop:2968 length:495 start_codon:yes stop_codon:yes gene_type:complete